ncbi:MAG: TraH family protein [Mesorhizobium sp.]
MIDAALIQQCADPGLKPAIIEKFIAQAGSSDPLTVSVRAGDRVVLVPKPKTADEAMALIRHHIGSAVVRVGVTQYPAGLGIADASELKPDLVDACANIRMGTALFGKVYRIVTKWYGNPVDEAFEDAIIAWRSGYFEGNAVFSEPDPGGTGLAEPNLDVASSPEQSRSSVAGSAMRSTAGSVQPADPNAAGIRIDLSGIASDQLEKVRIRNAR